MVASLRTICVVQIDTYFTVELARGIDPMAVKCWHIVCGPVLIFHQFVSTSPVISINLGPIAPFEASNSRRRSLPPTSLARTSVRRLLDSAWERRRLQLSLWSKRLTGIPKMYRR